MSNGGHAPPIERIKGLPEQPLCASAIADKLSQQQTRAGKMEKGRRKRHLSSIPSQIARERESKGAEDLHIPVVSCCWRVEDSQSAAVKEKARRKALVKSGDWRWSLPEFSKHLEINFSRCVWWFESLIHRRTIPPQPAMEFKFQVSVPQF